MMREAATLLGSAIAALFATAAAARAPDPAGGAQATATQPVVRKSTLKVLDRPLPGGAIKPGGDADPFGGRLLGRGYQQGWIEAGAELKLEQQFLAGQPATVALATDPDTPLALIVAEPGAGRACRSARGCRWLPEYTQRYAITLRNAGGARVRYVLVLK